MELDGSLPHSQVPATFPYPEPDKSNPAYSYHFLRIDFIILSSTPGPSKWSLSLRFPHQNPVYTSHPTNTCYIIIIIIIIIIITELF
jgi:hypothetical protein